MKKCYLYIRVSSEQQVSGDGLNRQESLLIKYFEDNAPVQDFDPDYELIIDEGRSAFKAEHLHESAGLGRFFKRVNDGDIAKGSVLIVESLDRFSRENPFKCVEYISQLDRAQIELHDVEKRLIISRKHSNSLTFATMIAERSYEESCLKSTRIRKGWDKRRKKAKDEGQYMIRNCPKWIDVVDGKYVLNENHILVREVFDLYLSGIRSYTIAQQLNAAGKLIDNKKWDSTKICHLLRNKRCKGEYTSNRTERNFDDDTVVLTTEIYKIYPKIVSEEEFAEVQRRLANHNYIGRVRNDLKKTVFNSLLKCSLCGAALTTSSTNGYTYIKCDNSRNKKGCEALMMPYMPFEKGVLKYVKGIDVEKVLNNLIGSVSDIDILKSEIVELETYIETFSIGMEKLRQQGRMPSFDMLDQKSQAEEKLQNTKEKLADKKDTVNVTNIEFSDDIHEISNIIERSKLELELRKIIKRIDVLPSKSHVIADIHYHNDDCIKHVLLINKKKSTIEAIGEIEKQDGWRTYSYSENEKLVFQVHSAGDVWTLKASKDKNVEDIQKYMVMMAGREPIDFDYHINEDFIEWI